MAKVPENSVIYASPTISQRASDRSAVSSIGMNCRRLLLGIAFAGYLSAAPLARSGYAQISEAPAQTTWQRGSRTVEAPPPRQKDSIQQTAFTPATQFASQPVPQPVLEGLSIPPLGGHQFQHAPSVVTGDGKASSEIREFAPTVDGTFQIPAMGLNVPQQSTSSGEASFENDPALFWWENDLTKSVLRSRRPYPLTLQQALGLALKEAPELQILHSDWYIRQTEAERQSAAFDWTTYVDSIWNRDSTPVSSALDGATQRLRSRSLSVAAGLRRLGPDGTTVDFNQQMGLRNSNSQFINPNNQGTTRLSLDIEKPLLRGAGEDYNSSPYRLAVIDKDVAFDRFQAGVQDHLLQVATAYWSLVLRRGVFLQSIESWNRAKQIADEMATRTEIDVTPVMLDRARSEVATRLSTSVEAEHDVIRAQEGLLRLIYGARFTDFTDGEVLPMSLPMRKTDSVDPQHHIEVALRNRSEVHEAIRQIKAAAVRFEVASNELLPQLNFVLSSYVAGLRGDNDVGDSFVSQFREGEPGVGVGLNLEIPYRNRAAKAAAEQTHVGIMRMQAQMQLTLGQVTEDVRGQVIQRNKFGSVLKQRWEALARARRILNYATARRSALADGTRVADLYLENLLNQQSRLQSAEAAYLDAQIRYTLADNSLLRSTSILDSLAEPVVTGDCESCSGAAAGHASLPITTEGVPTDFHAAPVVVTPVESSPGVSGGFGHSGF